MAAATQGPQKDASEATVPTGKAASVNSAFQARQDPTSSPALEHAGKKASPLRGGSLQASPVCERDQAGARSLGQVSRDAD